MPGDDVRFPRQGHGRGGIDRGRERFAAPAGGWPGAGAAVLSAAGCATAGLEFPVSI